MAENIVVNGVTYNGVDSVSMQNTDGKSVIFYPKANETSESYVKEEAIAVANRIANSNGTFKMVFVTDLHNMDDAPRLEHANQAIQALCRVTDIDCVVFGGDYIRNWSEITYEEAVEDIKLCRDKLKNQIVPTLWLRGNHDTNGYVGERITKQEAYNLIANKNVDNGAVINSADPYGNYGYLDFPSKKVRVVFVNTSDNDFMGEKEVADPSYAADLIGAHNVSATQLQWIADNALNFTESGWNVIFVSHLPLFFSTSSSPAWYNNHTYTDRDGNTWTCNLSNMGKLIAAYINKTSFSATLNGATASKNFSTLTNYAEVANGIAGHQHAFLVNTDGLVNYISVGNACEGGKESADGNSYLKVDNTAEDTTFDVIDFDFAEQIAYCWNYGAGYNRAISFRVLEIAVTGVSLSATSGTVQVGGTVKLVASVKPVNATNQNVTWKSSNTSVATVANGIVTAVATGNTVITATTEDGGYTATYALTVEAKPITNIIDTVGYKDGIRISASDGVSERDATGYTTTGMFDVPAGGVVRTSGVNFNTGTYSTALVHRYNSSTGAYVTSYKTTQTGIVGITFNLDANGNVTITCEHAMKIRLTGYGSGANLIVTINEEIT